MRRVGRAGTPIASLVVAVTALTALHHTRFQAQSPAGGPTFEAAILKPNAGNNGVSGGCRGSDTKLAPDDPRTVPLGRCVITSAALRHLLVMAFGVPLNRISGLPDWDGSRRFDLQATATNPATTSEAQLVAMLQQFLIEEFSLKIRRDVKDAPTFDLIVAKNGPKNFRPSEATGCSLAPAAATTLTMRGCSMQDLAAFLAGLPTVQRPVADKTGLTGRFDFSMDADSKAQNVGDLKAAMAGWEALFSDVQDQLGLRLERSNGSVETLVIEHAEMPRQK